MILQNQVVRFAMVLLLTSAQGPSCKHDTPPVCKGFYDLSGTVREKEFPTYAVDKQLDIYRCEMQKKPPASGWAYDIAKGGEGKLAAVTQRLKAEQDPVMQYHFIHLLQIMSEEHYFRGKHHIVNEVREVISRMGSSPVRTKAEEALSEIEKNARKD